MHPPLSYFLLIVVFVAVKEIIVFDTSLPSHLCPEQHCRGEDYPIHPPSSYFLLIVVFVAVKEIIVFDTSLPSHLSACCPAIAVAATLAIVTVVPQPLHHTAPPHGIILPSDDPNK